MKKIGIAVMILAVIGVAVAAGDFCHRAARDDKSRTETRKDKKGRKSVCRQIPDEHIA